MYVTCHVCIEQGAEAPAQESSFLCSRHRDALESCLDDIGFMWRVVQDDETLVGSKEPRALSATKSAPPCNLYILSLRDDRSKFTHKGDPVSALRVLRAWARAAAQARNEEISASGTEEFLGYLQKHMTWLCGQPSIVRFIRHMSALHRSLEQAVGRSLL